jgi:hypothetical protein
MPPRRRERHMGIALAAAQELAANGRLVRQALDSALQDKNLSRKVQSLEQRHDKLIKLGILGALAVC